MSVAGEAGDIDAWDVRRVGDWLHFTARLDALGPRGYRRPLAGGDIVAAGEGPVMGILSLGGARRAGFNDGPVRFRHHVLAPGDDVGAVGMEGTAAAAPTARLQHLPHASRDALIADTLLGWRFAAFARLPLIVVRAETDASASVAHLGKGIAWANFGAALDGLAATGVALDQPARVLAVSLDYGREDLTSPPEALAEGCRALMRRIERACADRGLGRPVFLASVEAVGLPGGVRAGDPAARAACRLAWSPGPHRLVQSAPGAAFAHDRNGRLTDTGRRQAAEMDAHAIVAVSRGKEWTCPLFLLAETEATGIRVTARAMGLLAVEQGADGASGFSLPGARVRSVRVAADDPQALILELDGTPGTDAHLSYEGGPLPQGGVRDDWSAPSASGQALHRWALPAFLPIRRGAA